MTCTIEWQPLIFSNWDQLFKRVPCSNMLQAYPYVHALCRINQQKSRLGLISINGAHAGFVVLREAGLFNNLLHGVIIDRAPLWFDGYGGLEHFKAFSERLAEEFPARFGRKRRFIPEAENHQKIQKILEESGFRRINSPGYQTIWLNLKQSTEDLRAGLRSNWRGHLRKAEKQSIKIEWVGEELSLKQVLSIYAVDKKTRGYNGPEASLLQALGTNFAANGDLIIGRALRQDKLLGFIIIFCHGKAATYQVGWSSEEGKKLCVNYRLLWEALDVLKARGIENFDLGGVNDGTASGVKKFKEGMGGRLTQLAGHYT